MCIHWYTTMFLTLDDGFFCRQFIAFQTPIAYFKLIKTRTVSHFTMLVKMNSQAFSSNLRRLGIAGGCVPSCCCTLSLMQECSRLECLFLLWEQPRKRCVWVWKWMGRRQVQGSQIISWVNWHWRTKLHSGDFEANVRKFSNAEDEDSSFYTKESHFYAICPSHVGFFQ